MPKPHFPPSTHCNRKHARSTAIFPCHMSLHASYAAQDSSPSLCAAILCVSLLLPVFAAVPRTHPHLAAAWYHRPRPRPDGPPCSLPSICLHACDTPHASPKPSAPRLIPPTKHRTKKAVSTRLSLRATPSPAYLQHPPNNRGAIRSNFHNNIPTDNTDVDTFIFHRWQTCRKNSCNYCFPHR